MYQVGHADSPNDDDPKFDNEPDALGAAIAQSWDDCVIAVWLWDDKGNAETVCLVFQQLPFWP